MQFVYIEIPDKDSQRWWFSKGLNALLEAKFSRHQS